MTKITVPEDILVKNFNNYRNGLIKLIGEDVTDKIINELGGEDKVMRATYSNLLDTGSAFEGSFIKNIIKMTQYANKINGLLPDDMKEDTKSIFKICMLCQIAKVISFEENDNNWEIANRGMAYKYLDLEGALRIGERSALICSNMGVKFTPTEYEAMRILDKTNDGDNYSKYFSSTLSMIVRQSSEWVTKENKFKFNK